MPDVCRTCGRPAGSPFRSYNADGKVAMGCIDDFHTGHLVTPSASAGWHASPAAKAWRAKMKKHAASMERDARGAFKRAKKGR